MKRIFACIFVLGALLGANYAHATACGTTTVSTASAIVDTDGFTWAGASYVANLVLPAGTYYSSAITCTTPGNTFNYQYSGTLTASGTMSVALPSNTNLLPSGTQWAITITPKAPAGSVTVTLSVTGATQTFSVTPTGPRFNASTFNFGYGVVEINSLIPTGALFLNTTTNLEQVWNGAAWQMYEGGLALNASGNILNYTALLTDDFLGMLPGTTGNIGNLGWDSTVIVGGTDPVAAAASVANHPGLITLTTDTTATHGVSVTLGHGVGTLFPGNSTGWQSQQIAEINQVSTGSYRIGFGTADTATAIPTNGIYFRFLNGTDTFIMACSDSSSTETCTATTVTPTAGDYVDFFMNSTTTGAINFTVQDITTPATSTVSLCPSGCTAAATVPTVVLSPMFNIAETGSSVADVLTVDYFVFAQSVTR
jgi:hypothetical protein